MSNKHKNNGWVIVRNADKSFAIVRAPKGFIGDTYLTYNHAADNLVSVQSYYESEDDK